MINIVPKYGTANKTHQPGRKVEYIAIHYTAGSSSRAGTALNVATMFANPKQQASADFIVDSGTIVQYNGDIENTYCWAVGGVVSKNKGAKLNGILRNSNSVSIEMCCDNPNWKPTDMPNTTKWTFSKDVIDNTVELVKYLMDKYHIDVNHVVRHYDATGKLCPGVIGWNEDSGDISAWNAFKARLVPQQKEEDDMITQAQFNEMATNWLASLADQPSTWEAAVMDRAVKDGIVQGDDKGRVMPKKPMTRGEMMTVLYRILDKANIEL